MRSTRRFGLLLALGFAPLLAQAQDQSAPEPVPETTPQTTPPPATDPAEPALDAEGFDRLTTGRTMDTYDAETGLYGVEQFLPGRRVLWQDAEGCVHGTWAQVGAQICFDYESTPSRRICWSYHDQGDHILGRFEGRNDTVPILLYPSASRLSCDAYIGA